MAFHVGVELILLGLIFLLFLTTMIYCGVRFEYRRKSPILAFYLALFFLFAWPTGSAMLFGGKYPDWVYVNATAFALIYVSLFLVFRVLVSRNSVINNVWIRSFARFKGEGQKESGWTFFFILVIAFVCFVFGLNITSFSAAMSLNWWQVVQSGSLIVLSGTYLSYSSAPMLVLAQWSKSTSQRRALAFLALTSFFLCFAVFVLKTRSYVLIFLVPLFMYMLYGSANPRIVKMAIYGVVIVFLFVLTRAVRHADDLSQFIDLGVDYFLNSAISGSEMEFVDAFYFFIQNDNAFAGFGQNITLQRVILFWLPAWGDWVKPSDFSYYMHAAYFGSMPSDALSMHPTVFGDAYGNAGYWGAVVYSVLLAVFFTLIEFFTRAVNSRLFPIAVFSLLAVNSLTFARGAIYNAFMFTVVPLVFLFFVLKFSCILNNLKMGHK